MSNDVGAIPYNGGVYFRVWAPFASEVFVTGTFNDWSAVKNPLASEGNGFWSGKVSNAAPEHRYKYVIHNPSLSKPLWKIDPYVKKLTSSAGDGIIYGFNFNWTSDSNYGTPEKNEMVIYEMHIGTFCDENTSDKIPATFTDAIKKLDHLQELGINAIELMPATEFPGDYSWGYNPAYPFAIESAYGGPDAFKNFVNECHNRGIAVILDVVYNHFGPTDLDLWVFDGWRDPHHPGGIYFYDIDRYDTPWGKNRPDYGRPEVRKYILDNALFWLEEFRLDGLRFDATAYIRNVYGDSYELSDGWYLMQEVNEEIKKRQPWKITIAEDLKNNEWITKSVSSNGAGFNSQWDSEFVHPIRRNLITPLDEDRNMYEIAAAIGHNYNNSAFQRVIYTESHDEVANGKTRLPSEIEPAYPGSVYAQKKSVIGAALVFTSPGIPMIFQGQEILEDKWFHDTHPIDWKKKEKYSGIFRLYGDLIRLRRNFFNNTAGLKGGHLNIHHINNDAGVIAFHRWMNGGPGDDVIVVVNFSNQHYISYNIGFPGGGQWKVRFNSDCKFYSNKFGDFPVYDVNAVDGNKDEMGFNGNVSIGNYSVIIFSQDLL